MKGWLEVDSGCGEAVGRQSDVPCLKPKGAVVSLSGHILELDFPEQYSKWSTSDLRELFHTGTRWVLRDRKAINF